MKPTAVPRFASLALILPLLFAVSADAADPADGPKPEGVEFFERKVRPVLASSCFECHGPKKQWAALRLDSRAAMLAGGDSGPAIVPGKPEKSRLIAAVKRQGDVQMPPESELTEKQVAALVRWVELGAPWPKSDIAGSKEDAAKDHWAFQPVRDAPVPPVAQKHGKIENSIDAFVLAKLDMAGLSTSPPADRRTLIRRATVDLTGLPPTPEEVEAFVANDDPKAYSQLIERLLASPHYGQQWGRHWLDVARYSDTKGYVYAREERFWVHAWAYRDWVVQALNQDIPYDRFLLLQLAADQAAPEDLAAQQAMGFLTLGRRFLGVQRDIIDDRIDVVTRGTMALTVSCARCHDHKYDPIPTADYYSLYGVFQSCAEKLLQVDQPEERNAAYVKFEEELHKRQQKLAETMAARRKETSDRVRARVGDYLGAQFELEKYPSEGFDQILAKTDILPGFVRHWQVYLQRTAERRDPIFVPWHAYAEIEGAKFAEHADQVTRDLLALPEDEIHPLLRQAFRETPASMREVNDRYAGLLKKADRRWQAALKQAADDKVSTPQRLDDLSWESLRQVMYGSTAPCEVPDESIVNNERFFDSGSVTELWKQQGEVDRWLIRSPISPPHALLLVDRQTPATPHVFRRGNPADQGDTVPRQFLQVLAGEDRQPFEQGSGRLEMARAIIDPANPLTARVMVNRVWMHHFGEGLVRTPSDFGTRASPPSHPRLLDWLTSGFIQEGWSLKKLHRRLMLSRAYRQSSRGPVDVKARAAAQQADPENRLLWRMNARRLSFEEMRDSLLAVTGSLDPAVGGKPGELFDVKFRRRTLYGLIDRQFLPGTLRMFDFANPDLHSPQRSDTTVPQQALFFLNHEIPLARAGELAAKTESAETSEERVRMMYRLAYQRQPTDDQLAAAQELIRVAEQEREAPPPATVAHWQYGFGKYDEDEKRLNSFTPLPHFTGSAWQGGPKWPDAKLGWVQLTAGGGHAGNDRDHAAVRRWVAPQNMTVQVSSALVHGTSAGDGIRGFLVSSRQGLLGSAEVHNNQAEFDQATLRVQQGETLDFVVDIGKGLNNDQFTWEVQIRELTNDGQATVWKSLEDFNAQGPERLGPWQQLAQVLLSANEFLFID